jgi:hypothetical protein
MLSFNFLLFVEIVGANSKLWRMDLVKIEDKIVDILSGFNE